MKIIYTYLATDGEETNTSLSPSFVNYTLYPSSFVADNSNFAFWDIDE